MHRMKMYLQGFLLTCGIMLFTSAWPRDFIVDSGVINPVPIAIVPFSPPQDGTPAPVDIATIISEDLARSARFSSLDTKTMPQQPHELNEVEFQDWQRLGTEILVIGRLKQAGNAEYIVDYKVVDAYKGQEIAAGSIPSAKSVLRRTAHEISDIIYQKLTGTPGAFATQIVYVRVIKSQKGSRRYTLEISDADGHNRWVLLKSKEPLLSPVWSPDGKKLAYVSFESRNSAIYVQDLKSGAREMVASNPGINSAPAWSPDGAHLALTLSKEGNPDVYVMHVASRQLRRITNNRAIDTEPTWSPDGKMLAFTSDRGGTPQIYEIPVEGGEPKRLTFEGAYNTCPVYSPDGKYLALVRGEGHTYRIGHYDRSSKQVSVLSNTRMGESPSFAPNGHMIIYTTYAAAGARGTTLAVIPVGVSGATMAAIPVDGGMQPLPVEGEIREPAWGPITAR